MRFFLENAAQVGDVVTLNATDSHHLSRVLRCKPGAQIELVSANRVFSAEILSVDDLVSVRLLAELAAYSEAPLDLILLQGLAKGERMEIVLQKAVELGASRIVPVACARSVVRLAGLLLFFGVSGLLFCLFLFLPLALFLLGAVLILSFGWSLRYLKLRTTKIKPCAIR